jgi:hypothetical protein
MPYITQCRREDLDSGDDVMQSPGELNYRITKLIGEYLDEFNICYDTFNDVVGALEGAKLEFYRRVVAPYEDDKIKKNGDVY